jgi:hypothetical protein
MKQLQLTGIALIAVMFLASCGGEDNTKIETEDAVKIAKESLTEIPSMEDASKELDKTLKEVVETVEKVDNVSSNNSECDDFLKGYENFTDKYIDIIKKQKANPSDMSIMTEYASLMGKASDWATKTPDCSDAKFVSKLSKIQLKIANAASGM